MGWGGGGVEKCRVTSSDFFDGWGKENYAGGDKTDCYCNYCLWPISIALSCYKICELQKNGECLFVSSLLLMMR
jgi:hypothetical protein